MNEPSRIEPSAPSPTSPRHGHARIVREPMSGASAIWESLEREGVEVVFGYPGGAIMPAYDALPASRIRHVLVRHEQGAAHMADGYARASGRVGVAVGTSGPGATNLVTGIATAKMDSIPLVCITGQVCSHLIGTSAFQETDIVGITQPITKKSTLVTRAADVAPALREAIRLARSGRPGPVLVDITKDAQQGTAPFVWSPPESALLVKPEARAVEQALSLIARAERPLVLAGHGVIQSGASSLLLEFVERSQIPVASTLLGLGGFPGSHPRHLGMIGMHGDPWVNQAVQESDLIVAIGMRFDDRVTGNPKTFAQSARKIHIELDPKEVNKLVPVDVAIVADARLALAELAPSVVTPSLVAWHRRIDALHQAALVHDIQATPSETGLHAAHVVRDIWHITKGRATVVTDVGQHQMWEAQYFKHERPRSLITSGGLGTMGFALPAAIGAKIARPEEEVWVIAGDGGFQMTASELATIAQEGIKLNIAIINNGHLGLVRQLQEHFYGGRYVAAPISSPDFCALARAHGLLGATVERREDLAATIELARRSAKTFLIDFRVVQHDSVYPVVPAGADLDAMLRRPSGGSAGV